MLRGGLTLVSLVTVVIFGVLWFRGGQPAVPAARLTATTSPTGALPQAQLQAQAAPALPSPTVRALLPQSIVTATATAPTSASLHDGTGDGAPEMGELPATAAAEESEPIDETGTTAEQDAAATGDATADLDDEPVSPIIADLPDGWEMAIATLDGGVMGYVTSPSLNIRAAPAVDGELVGETYAWHTLTVYGAVTGDWVEHTNLWYLVGEGQYVTAAHVEPFNPAPPETTYDGTWVDVNLATGYAIAYQDDVPVYAAIVMWGKPGFETPLGVFEIYARVASETMDAATVGVLPDDPEYYYLPDVRWTQYFEQGGFALHSNYWDPPSAFGGEASHGCINLLEPDAAWFWNFLDVGSVVSIHES